ncbi:MAG: LuxR family transcriptional regulator [Gammaproteobacteria bacterium]
MNVQEVEKLFTIHFAPLSEDIKKWCQPFFTEFSINYFDYARFNHLDRSCHVLVSDVEYATYFLKFNNYETFKYYRPPTTYLPTGRHLWLSYNTPQFLSESNEHFSHYWGLTMVRAQKDYDEVFNFAASMENKQTLDLFLNHSEIFDIFINCFLEHFAYVFKTAHHRVILPEYIPYKIIETKNETPVVMRLLKALDHTTTHNKQLCPMLFDDKLISITKKEMMCLTLLAQGLSAKEIARKLDISFRTVEIHCANLLKKSNSHNRVDLISKVDQRILDGMQGLL